MADFFEDEDEVRAEARSPRRPTLKRSLIVAVLLLLGAGGTYAYMQLGDKIGPSKAEKEKLAEFDRLQQENKKAGGITIVSPEEAERLALLAKSTQASSTEMIASSTIEVASSTAELATSTSELPRGLAKADIKLKILNGSGVSGVGGRAGKLLEAEGFKISSLGNANSFDFAISEIRHSKGEAASAEAVDQALGGDNKLVEDLGLSGEIIVTLGQNFK